MSIGTDEIRTRLDALAGYIKDLKEIEPHTYEEYEADKMLRRYAERMLHMAVEAAITVGVHVLTEEGLRSPENYHDVFVVLGEHGILPRELVRGMTDLVELRNLLVHEHDVVDDTMVYGALKRRLEVFTEFIARIEAYRRGDPLPPAELTEDDLESDD
jgi:uncharacterized protein YutE (UPF0331/DUF86 family)